MPDREKVIKGLEYCMGGCQVSCFKCPYREIGHQPPDCLDNCMILQDAVDLLKEQEAVKPNFDKAWNSQIAECGACGTVLFNIGNYKAKYCSECGKKVKWDEAD